MDSAVQRGVTARVRARTTNTTRPKLDPAARFGSYTSLRRAECPARGVDRPVMDVHLSTDSAPKLDAPPDPGTSARMGASGLRPVRRRRALRAPRALALDELWRRYAHHRDDATRNLLVERYQGLVEEIVRHFAQRLPRSVDRGDLGTASNVGLMAAIEGFDPTRGVRFESYCELRVKGALLDELRSQDWLPRPWRQRIEQHKRVVERLRSELVRDPDEGEVARAMELPLSEYRQFFGVGLPGTPAGGVATAHDEEDAFPGLEIVPDDASGSVEEKLTREEILRLVAQRLTVQEYRLVYLKYWEELSMREIGALMHLSESRVCKMHQKLLERLSERLGGDVHG